MAADVYTPPGSFGGYANVTGVVDGTAAPQIVTIFAQFLALFGTQNNDITAPTHAAHPDFNKIPPEVLASVRNEVAGMAAAIAAAPT